jgi:hypothetical protein
LLTIPPAARRWPDIGSPATWYRRIARGELPPGAVVRLGGRYYVRVALIEAWLEGAAPDASQTELGDRGRLRAV